MSTSLLMMSGATQGWASFVSPTNSLRASYVRGSGPAYTRHRRGEYCIRWLPGAWLNGTGHESTEQTARSPKKGAFTEPSSRSDR